MACPGIVSPAPRNVAIASLAPATTGRSSGRPSSCGRPCPEPADDRPGPRRGRSHPLVEPGSPRLRDGDRLDRVLERRRRHARHSERQVVPRREKPGGILDHLGPQRREQERPSEQADHPASTTDRRDRGGRLIGGAPVQPRDGRRQGASVGRRGNEGRALAHNADRQRLDRALARGPGQGDAEPAAEGGPPGLGVLLRAAGRAVEEQGVRNPGEATQAPVRRENARLEGGGPEVDGDEDAGIGGHGGDRR